MLNSIVHNSKLYIFCFKLISAVCSHICQVYHMNKCSIPNIKSSSYALYCSCWIHLEAAMLKSNILGPLKKSRMYVYYKI